jgi:hypothetical protein
METVKIGNQEWSTTNLNVDVFRNGDIIPEIKSFVEWQLFQILISLMYMETLVVLLKMLQMS